MRWSIRLYGSALFLILLIGCSQQRFETIVTVPISVLLKDDNISSVSESAKKFLEENGMACVPYGDAPGINCSESSGRNEISSIRVLFHADDVVQFRVWTLPVVLFRSKANRVHSRTENLLLRYLAGIETKKIEYFVDGQRVVSESLK